MRRGEAGGRRLAEACGRPCLCRRDAGVDRPTQLEHVPNPPAAVRRSGQAVSLAAVGLRGAVTDRARVLGPARNLHAALRCWASTCAGGSGPPTAVWSSARTPRWPSSTTPPRPTVWISSSRQGLHDGRDDTGETDLLTLCGFAELPGRPTYPALACIARLPPAVHGQRLR
jgi:hypothetical protein